MGLENNIPEGWAETSIGKVTVVKSGGTPSTKNSSYWGDEIPWITPRDLSSFKDVFIEKGERSISIEGLENSSAKLLPKNTILFSSRAPIGYVVIAQNETATNQGFKNLICDEVNSHFKYFYYLMKYKADFIERLSSGSTFSEASGTLIKSIELNLPPLQEQKVIAKVLTAFDDKIELLQAQNKTLETMAQTIFKEWFVAKERIDWKKVKIKDFDAIITDYVANGSFASLAENVTYIREKDYAKLIRLTDFNNGFSGDFVYVDKKAYEFLNKSKLKGGEVIISNVGAYAGTVFKCPQLNSPMTLGPNSIVIKSNFSNYFYLLFTSRIGKHYLDTIITGSAQPKFNKTSFRGLELSFPNKSYLVDFEVRVSPLMKKIEQNKIQFQSLTKTRDTLLPKLMSGQVRVNNIKQTADA